jgi:hypothetical protein
MSFIQYCKLLAYFKTKKQQQKQNNTTSYTIYIVFILFATISYLSRNGTGFY